MTPGVSYTTPNLPPPAPLPAVLLLTFLGSLGTGAVTNGVYFLADATYAFSPRENLLLGAWFGVTYVAAALLIGPGLSAAIRRTPRVTSRAVLAALNAALALLCLTPSSVGLLTGESPPPRWSLWLMTGLYAPVTGAMWPIVESYLSGGRRAATLRRATGHFNVVWSSALIVAFFAMGPLLRDNPLLILIALAGVHLLSVPIALILPRDPARTPPNPGEPHPASYEGLLAVFRVLLPTSYVVMSALSPLLPTIEARLGVPVPWMTAVAAVWLISRTAAFWIYSHWHGWHGRWWLPIVATLGLLAGFAMVALSPVTGSAGIPLLVAGLIAVGACQGMIYLASIYYALELGDGAVHAGGTHEGLIGIGYTVGPLCGVAAATAFPPPDSGFEPAFVFIVLAVVAIAVSFAIARGRQAVRKTRSQPK